MADIYAHQVKHDRYFLHEHPLGARSWQLSCIQKILGMKNVKRVRCDRCMTGLLTWSNEGTFKRAKKPTGFMTNSEEMSKILSLQCDQSHSHQHLMGGRATYAAFYPKELCELICKGMIAQYKADRKTIMTLIKNDHEEIYYDDVYLKRRRADKVRAARQ